MLKWYNALIEGYFFWRYPQLPSNHPCLPPPQTIKYRKDLNGEKS